MPDLVSIIIPVYNRFGILARTIKSVFDQSYDNWEIIVIDDCSNQLLTLTDLFPNEILLEKCILHRNGNNLGPGLSRQKGVSLSSGTFICFLDADDYWHSDFLLHSINVHLLHPSITASYTIVEEKWGNDKIIRKNSSIGFEHIFPENIMTARPWATSCLMWRKQFIGNWTDLRTTQDVVFEFNSAIINNKIKHIPIKLCFVDKSTGENSADLVKYEQSLTHRHQHTKYFLENSDKISHSIYDHADITKVLYRNLIKNTARILNYADHDQLIQEGIKLSFKSTRSQILLCFFSVTKNYNLGRKVLSRYLSYKANKYTF